MRRNNKTFGQIKEEVKESEAVKQDFAKAANIEYRSRYSMTGEQKYNLIFAIIVLFGVIGFFAVLTLPFILS